MRKLVCGVFLAVLMHGAAQAQRFEVSIFGGIPLRFSHPVLGSLSQTPVDTDTTLTKGNYTVGARVTVNSKGYYGHELSYSIQHMTLTTLDTITDADGNSVSKLYQDKVKLEQFSYNFLVYFMPRGERWRPFVTGGAQVYRWGAPHFDVWPAGGYRNLGLNFGGGLKIKLLPHTLARLDVREYIGGRPYVRQLQLGSNTLSSGFTHLLEASAGFGLTF
jgi:hypothetical protein